jgi:hypothetical protein
MSVSVNGEMQSLPEAPTLVHQVSDWGSGVAIKMGRRSGSCPARQLNERDTRLPGSGDCPMRSIAAPGHIMIPEQQISMA